MSLKPITKFERIQILTSKKQKQTNKPNKEKASHQNNLKFWQQIFFFFFFEKKFGNKLGCSLMLQFHLIFFY